MKLDRIIAVRNHKTVYRDGELCMKVFDETYSKADILAEAMNQARVEETGLHIPQVREVTVIDGKWTIMTDYIKGKTLAQLMEEHPEKKNDWLNLFVDLQLEVQSKTCPLLPKLRDKMDRKISLTDFDATTRYELHTRLESCPKHAKLCHGDFNPSNIIISEDGNALHSGLAHASRGTPRRTSPKPICVLACGRYRRRRTLPQTVLHQERHRKAICSEMDADRCCRSIAQRQRKAT